MEKKKTINLDTTFKVVVILYLILSYINLFLPDGISARIYPEQEMYQDIKNKLFVLLRWANDMSLIVLPVSIFYNKKVFNKIAIYILPSILLACVFCFEKYIQMYTNGLGEGLMNIRFFSESFKSFFVNITFRSIYLTTLFILESASIIYIAYKNKSDYKFENKKEIKSFFLVLLGVFLVIMPIYAPSYIFNGYALGSDLSDNVWWNTFVIGSFEHILWILYIPVEIIVLYKIFKKFNKDDQYLAIVVMSLALLFEFSGIYTCFGEIVTQRYPLQLCNLGSLTMLPIILSKNKVASRFALFVNVPGALVAVALCDSANAGVTYIMNVHYIVEHTKVISIPVLAYLLGIFEPINKKSIKEVLLDFSIYYLFVFILGGIFTGLYNKTSNDYWSCNYLFMFNRESTTNILSFTGVFFDINFKIFDFFTIALIHPLIYVGFSVYLVLFFVLFYNIDKKVRNKINNKKLIQEA